MAYHKPILSERTYLKTAIAPGANIIRRGSSTDKLSQRFTKQRRMRPCATCSSRPLAAVGEAGGTKQSDREGEKEVYGGGRERTRRTSTDFSPRM